MICTGVHVVARIRGAESFVSTMHGRSEISNQIARPLRSVVLGRSPLTLSTNPSCRMSKLEINLSSMYGVRASTRRLPVWIQELDLGRPNITSTVAERYHTVLFQIDEPRAGANAVRLVAPFLSIQTSLQKSVLYRLDYYLVLYMPEIM